MEEGRAELREAAEHRRRAVADARRLPDAHDMRLRPRARRDRPQPAAAVWREAEAREAILGSLLAAAAATLAAALAILAIIGAAGAGLVAD